MKMSGWPKKWSRRDRRQQTILKENVDCFAFNFHDFGILKGQNEKYYKYVMIINIIFLVRKYQMIYLI
jgi:hypothetical protein